jgi:hypothetical protein
MDKQEEKIAYVKTGGGNAYLDIDGERKTIVPGKAFYAHPEDIPAGFKDLFTEAPSRAARKESRETAKAANEPPADDAKAEPAERGDKPEFDIVPADAPGWYDVLNKSTGKKLNEKKLRAEEAQKFVQELSA